MAFRERDEKGTAVAEVDSFEYAPARWVNNECFHFNRNYYIC